MASRKHGGLSVLREALSHTFEILLR